MRSRTFRAPPDAVWRLLADPYAFPRWWPLVRRVEGVGEAEWTMVLGKPGRRGIRADQVLEASEEGRLRRWALVVPGSPFERILSASVTEARLEPTGGGCALTLAVEQRPVRWTRLAPFLLRRAARQQLDEALDGMARAVEA